MSYGGSSGSSRISTAADAALNSPSTGDVLTYNTSTQKWSNAAIPDDGTKLSKAANLSDVASASTARVNLGLATIAASGSASDLTTGTVPLALIGTGTPAAGKYIDGATGAWTALPVGGSGAPTGNVTDRILYVSKAGSDSNTGLSWNTAFLTVGAAINALSFYYGVIYVGYGTFIESNLSLQGTQKIRGVGRHGTIIQLASSGTLLDLDQQSNPSLEALSLAFASSSVTGTLVSMSNAFTCTFLDVGFDGTATTGQIGVSLTNNSGDSHFIGCEFQQCDVGVNNQTTVNYFTDCNFTSNKSAGIRGGATPQTGGWLAGAVISSCTFRGTGDYYIDINGTAQSWDVNGCWFDGQATTAIRVGVGSNGPWMFKLTNCPYLSGATTSLALNMANVVELNGILFGNSGTSPSDITVGPNSSTNLTRGHLGPYLSLQGRNLASILPSSGWTTT